MPERPAADRWTEILDRQDATELSAREFAAREGLNARTLAWWRSRLGRQKPSPSAAATCAFVEVRTATPALRVRLGVGDAYVLVDEHTELGLLRAVLAALC